MGIMPIGSMIVNAVANAVAMNAAFIVAISVARNLLVRKTA
jgi:hypothetical protein